MHKYILQKSESYAMWPEGLPRALVYHWTNEAESNNRKALERCIPGGMEGNYRIINNPRWNPDAKKTMYAILPCGVDVAAECQRRPVYKSESAMNVLNIMRAYPNTFCIDVYTANAEETYIEHQEYITFSALKARTIM